MAQPVTGSAKARRGGGSLIGWLWQSLRGNGTVVSGAARFTDSVKNLATSATLAGTSILAAVTDPFVAQAARRLAGIPAMRQAGSMVKMLSSAAAATRSCARA